MSGNRILIISEYISKSQNSTGYYWQSLINLASNVFTNTRVLTVKSQQDDFSDISEKVQIIPASNRHYFQVQGKKRIAIQTLLSFKFFIRSLFLLKRGDVIFCGTNPAPFIFFAALLKKLKRVRWVLLVHDVFPENLVATKLITKQHILYKIISYVFSWAYSKPDKIIAIGRDMEELLLSKCKRPISTTYIPNWAEINDSEVVSKSDSEIVKKLNIKDKVIIQFFGNIGSAQGISKLLKIIGEIENDDVNFVFAGGGSKVGELENFIANNDKNNVHYIGQVPLSQKETVLGACDLSCVVLEQGMLGLGVPSKTYFALAANTPILAIAEIGSELQYLTMEHNIGDFFDIQDERSIVEYINSLSLESIESRSFQPRNVFNSFFTKKVTLDAYATLLKTLKDLK